MDIQKLLFFQATGYNSSNKVQWRTWYVLIKKYIKNSGHRFLHRLINSSQFSKMSNAVDFSGPSITY